MSILPLLMLLPFFNKTALGDTPLEVDVYLSASLLRNKVIASEFRSWRNGVSTPNESMSQRHLLEGPGTKNELCAIAVFSAFVVLGGCGFFYCLYLVAKLTNRRSSSMRATNRTAESAARAAPVLPNSDAQPSGQEGSRVHQPNAHYSFAPSALTVVYGPNGDLSIGIRTQSLSADRVGGFSSHV